LALLSAIVLVLAFSAIYGLYQYRPVSEAIRQRTRQVSLASALAQRAEAMVRSYASMSELPQVEGLRMIEAEPLINTASLKRAIFQQSVTRFQIKLEHLITATQSHEPTALVPTERQLAELNSLQSSFENFHAIYVESEQFTYLYEQDVADRLEDFASQADLHLANIKATMEDVCDYVDDQYRTWSAMALTCTVLALTMVGILLVSFRSLVMKPFRTLLDGSRLVAGGQFDHRIDLGTGDELSELADAMNEMTDRFQGALAQVNAWCTDLDRQVRQRTREVIQNEQLASVGFLAAVVAHEINNPLATIAWSAESLQSRIGELMVKPADKRVADDELCESLTNNLRRIEDEAYRCKGITEKLLDFSRLSEVRRADTDLAELVGEVVSMVGQIGKYRCKTIRVHTDDENPVIAQVNPQEIRQVILNLVTNALESVDCDGAVDIHCSAADGYATVLVKDNGCGMSREVLQHVFEPFFTRRRDGTGTGLGLSITYRIVSQHGGSLIADSEGEGKGSQMEMRLPVRADSDVEVSIHRSAISPPRPAMADRPAAGKRHQVGSGASLQNQIVGDASEPDSPRYVPHGSFDAS